MPVFVENSKLTLVNSNYKAVNIVLGGVNDLKTKAAIPSLMRHLADREIPSSLLHAVEWGSADMYYFMP